MALPIENLEVHYEGEFVKQIIKRARLIEAVFNQAADEIVQRINIGLLKYDQYTYAGSFFRINQNLERQINQILTILQKEIVNNIKSGTIESWELANTKNNILVENFTDGVLIPGQILKSFNQVNLSALEEFINRKIRGMGLSERVWNLVETSKSQLELYLSSGITTGKSAAKLSQDIRQCLKNPNVLFRRVRNEKGELVLSKAARKFHPGQGVYRSAYQNTLRLTQTENNMAYRMSDWNRRQQLPFVLGYEVHLSLSHPEWDICDEMAGTYPKEFIFASWHPRCICYTTAILSSKDEFIRYTKTGFIDRRKTIKSIPSNAQGYLTSKRDQITGWKNQPYFIRDNMQNQFIKETFASIKKKAA